ncbi:Suppressor of the cold-sensitive snRNP bioproteinsis mutant brr1-1, partial [Perkinsus olseni]
VVAVVDTGVEIGHPDLRHQVFSDSSCRHGFGVGEESEDVGDVKGHGTHCGGVLGATTNNSLGKAGISRAKIMPIRVLGPGGKGSVMEVMAGLDFAVQQKVDILSNSYAGSIRSELLKRSISLTAELGMLFVCAAGNEGKDISVKKVYPCAFTEELDNILCVGSSDKDLPYILARHSNYAPYLDVAAPGVQILSTFPGRSYRFMTGTSMATPHVSGVAAMLMQMGLSARDARAVIKNSTEVLENAFFVPVVKYGRLNALKAVRAAAVLPTVPPKPRRSLGGGNCVPSETPETPGRSWAPRGSVLASLLFMAGRVASIIVNYLPEPSSWQCLTTVCKSWATRLITFRDTAAERARWPMTVQLRPRIWHALLLDEDIMTRDIEEDPLAYYDTCWRASAEDDSVASQVWRDVVRTEPCASCVGCFHHRLWRVLMATSERLKTVGYCQGMNYVVNILLK